MTTAGPATPAFRHEKGNLRETTLLARHGPARRDHAGRLPGESVRHRQSDPRARLLGVALYKIPSRSMEPTLQQGDFIPRQRRAYAFADPQVGDLVVFRFPPQRSIAYVKRIAGIPGDRVDRWRPALRQ